MAQLEPTIQNVLQQTSLRWIFVGGKGGVGKTTTSCSIALQLAKHRRSVLVISTDPAHNLSDAFQQKVTSTPTPVQGVSNLFAMEVDPQPQKLELQGITDAEGGFLKELVGAIPGIDEAMSFAEVMKLLQSLDYEAVVFDTAPTGHTLRLMQFPDTLEKGLNKLSSLETSLGPMMSAVGPMLGAGGADTGGLFSQMRELKRSVTEVKTQFQDARLTTFICVCIPEFLSLFETERLVQELTKQDIDVHNVVINQVIMKGPEDKSPLLDARIRMQQKYLEQYDELYGDDMHVIKMPLLAQEVRGVQSLTGFSTKLVDPATASAAAAAEADAGGAPAKSVQDLEKEVAYWKGQCERLQEHMKSKGIELP